MSQQLSLTAAGGLSTRIASTSSSSSAAGVHLYETISRERWVEAIRRLAEGHVYRGQGSGPAVHNLVGCILAQKAGNRTDRGYVQVDPPCLTAAHRREPAMSWQSAHRIICFLHKGADDVRNLLYEGYEASHLCHMSKCINPDHLSIETHDDNMSRRQCEGRVDIITTINDHVYLLPCPLTCPHHPACINQREQREARECGEQEEKENENEEDEIEDESDVICLD